MADKSVGELIAAQSVTPTDLFVLEQNGTAKKLTGQILENWLVSFADGHGGIQSFDHVGTSGLVDTYRITMADTTTFDFDVNNGRGINTIKKTGTIGLVDTYTINFNDATSSTFEVANGAKGDKGDNQYVWIKYASQKPTASSHSFGDVADNWIGIYSGASETAPTDWTQYEWFQIKGEKGDTGEAARLMSSAVEYQVSDSGTIIPSGAWLSSVPVVAQGKYLWTRTNNTFNTGSPVVAYSVSRMGLDGSGSVSSVANISPDENGNVPLTAENINALPNTGGYLTGELRMNGQTISGLNAPMANDQAANMGFVNQQMKKAAPRNLLDNSDFRNPVNQRGYIKWTRDAAPEIDASPTTQYGITADGGAYTVDRWRMVADIGTINLVSDGLDLDATNNAITFTQTLEPALWKRIVDTGRKYTLAIHYTVSESGMNPITLFEHLNDNNVKVISNIPNTPGIHTAVFCFKPDTTGGIYGYSPFHMFAQFGNKLTLHWVAFYEGEYTIDTLPEYQPKGYGAELRECKRYYQRFSYGQYTTIGLGYEGPTYAFIQLSGEDMRIQNPTMTISAPIQIGSRVYTPTSCDIHNETIIIGVNYDVITTNIGGCYSYCPTAGGCVIEMSADL